MVDRHGPALAMLQFPDVGHGGEQCHGVAAHAIGHKATFRGGCSTHVAPGGRRSRSNYFLTLHCNSLIQEHLS
jgi:hypothetical protein